MKKILVTFLIIGLVLPTIASTRAQEAAQKVLVVIWDGVEWTRVEPLYTSGLLPNAARVGELHRLTANRDCFTSGEQKRCMKTFTKPQHATMLTGCLADVHGTFSNNTFQLIPNGLTVYEQIETLDASIETAHLTNKPWQIGAVLFGNITDDVNVFFARQTKSKTITKRTINLINQWWDKDFFIVTHFKTPDVVGHSYGSDSMNYRKAILENDAQFGLMLNSLEQHGILYETHVYLLSDHGFSDKDSHNFSPNTFIVSNDPGVTDLLMKDVAGILLANFSLQPQNCGK